MSGRAIKDTLFVPVSVDALRDERLTSASMVAQLVYFRGLLHAKAAARDGIVTRREVVGALFDTPLSTAQGDDQQLLSFSHVEVAIAELVDLALWDVADEQLATYRVTGWLKHNDPVEAVENRKRESEASRRRGAHRTNHQLGRHQDPVPGCPDCPDVSHGVTHGVSPGQSASHAPAIAKRNGSESVPSDASESSAVGTETETETETEPPLPNPRSTQEGISTSGEGRGAEADATNVVTEALAILGLANPRPRPHEVLTVARALDRGWPPATLIDFAREAVSKPEVREHRKYLFGAWEKRANRDPDDDLDTTPIEPVRPAGLARPHPIDCPGGCDNDGWIDLPNGQVAKCTGQPIEAQA